MAGLIMTSVVLLYYKTESSGLEAFFSVLLTFSILLLSCDQLCILSVEGITIHR